MTEIRFYHLQSDTTTKAVPGIFNSVGNDTTVYIAERTSLQDLRGVFIHFTKPGEPATTITAQQGGLITHNGKPLVVVFNGTRQQFNAKTGGIDNLKFERYSLDLSSLTSGGMANLRQDPNEKTVTELWSSPVTDMNTKEAMRAKAEFHNRLSRPLLTVAFALMSLVPFMIGRFNRRGQAKRMTSIIVGILALQILSMVSASLASSSIAGIILLYTVPAAIIFVYATLLMSDKNYYKRFITLFNKESMA